MVVLRDLFESYPPYTPPSNIYPQISPKQQRQQQQQSKNIQCLPLEGDDGIQQLVADSDQVFVFMAAKVAGSSMKEFTQKCMGASGEDNFVNESEESFMNFLLGDLYPPKLVSSHIYNEEPFVHAIRHAARDSLFIYMYRDETERLQSSIRDVVKERLCRPPEDTRPTHMNTTKVVLELTEKECKISEHYLVRNNLKPQQQEVGISIHRTLSCPVWEEIDASGPTIVFVDYAKANALQEVLASRFCPHVQPMATNVHEEKAPGVNFSIVRQNGDEIPLKEWVKAKRSVLEYALSLSPPHSCKRRVRQVADTLSSCPNDEGAVRVVPRD